MELQTTGCQCRGDQKLQWCPFYIQEMIVPVEEDILVEEGMLVEEEGMLVGEEGTVPLREWGQDDVPLRYKFYNQAAQSLVLAQVVTVQAAECVTSNYYVRDFYV